MAKGLLVSTTKWPKQNRPAVVEDLMFEDVAEGRKFVEDNKTFVFHTQLVEVIKHGKTGNS